MREQLCTRDLTDHNIDNNPYETLLVLTDWHQIICTFKKTLLVWGQRKPSETDQVYYMDYGPSIVLFPLFYLSSSSTYSPCPLSHYLPITSSSCGLLVTMETSRFALLLSTLVLIFPPILFPFPVMNIFKTECRCVVCFYLFICHIWGSGEWWVFCVNVCFQHWGSLTVVHSDNIVHCCLPTLLSAYIECIQKEKQEVLYININPHLVHLLCCVAAAFCSNYIVCALLFLHHEKTLEIYWIWFMITTSSPGAT